MRRCLAIALPLVLAVALVPDAGAATVSARLAWETDYKTGSWDVAYLRFDAEHGEANRLTVTHRPPPGPHDPLEGEWTFTDPGAVLHASGTCRSVELHQVVCAIDGHDYGQLEAELGDLDDEAVADGAWARLRGGLGDDVLTAAALEGEAGADRLNVASPRHGEADGGPDDDIVIGGNEPDSLSGGGGRDVVVGAGGDDRITDGDATWKHVIVDRDVLDGGPGRDTVSWYSHPQPLSVDLVRRDDQAPGADDVRAFESVVGGAGDDRIVADDGPNILSGGAGDDRIEARGGADIVAGESGDDRLHGGPGPDRISAGAGVDAVAGGTGPDRLLVAGDLMADQVGCDHLDRGRVDAPELPASRCPGLHRRRVHGPVDAAWRNGRRMTVTFSCPADVACPGWTRLAARVDGNWVGLGRHRIRCSTPLDLSCIVRRVRLPRGRRVVVRAETVLDPGRRAGALMTRERFVPLQVAR